MAELLSQEEIDALLNTLDVQGEPSKEETIQETKKISLYDFKRPDKVSKEQIRSLRNLHDKFARNFSSRLSALLRAITEVKVLSVDQMTYGEFVLSLSNNVSFNVMDLQPLDGSGVFSIEPDIGFVLIDRLLGGIGEFDEKLSRPFTDIEQSILVDVVKQAMEDMKIAWEPIIKMNLDITDQETSSNVIQITAPSEVVVLVVFELKVGESKGFINWCLPVIVLEPIFNKIGTHDIVTKSKKTQEESKSDIILLLLNVLVHLEFYLGSTNITIKDFLDLKKNDILVLDNKTSEPLKGYVNNVEKFMCKIGKSENNMVVKLLTMI